MITLPWLRESGAKLCEESKQFDSTLTDSIFIWGNNTHMLINFFLKWNLIAMVLVQKNIEQNYYMSFEVQTNNINKLKMELLKKKLNKFKTEKKTNN